MYKKNGRVTYRSNRRQNYKRSNTYSSSKGRNKGNVVQQYQKYLKLAKEASSSGDRIQTEYFYQFTDHYSRLMQELGITFGENESNSDFSYQKNLNNKEDNENKELDEKESNMENESKQNDSLITEEENKSSSNAESDSLESVSFLSEPTKKKKSKIKKTSS